MTELNEAASHLLKAVESIEQRIDFDVTGDTAQLLRNVAKSTWRITDIDNKKEIVPDADINTIKVPAPGCIRLGFENLRQARSRLGTATLSNSTARVIIESILKTVEEALEELAPLRTIADSYDEWKDPAFPEFVGNADFEAVFHRVQDHDWSDWGSPSRLHEFVSAVDRWLRRYAEELIFRSSELADAGNMADNEHRPVKSGLTGTERAEDEFASYGRVERPILNAMKAKGARSKQDGISSGQILDQMESDGTDFVTRDTIRDVLMSDKMREIVGFDGIKRGRIYWLLG